MPNSKYIYFFFISGTVTTVIVYNPQDYPPPRPKSIVILSKILKYACITADILALLNILPVSMQPVLNMVPWTVRLPEPYRFPSFEIIEPDTWSSLYIFSIVNDHN